MDREQTTYLFTHLLGLGNLKKLYFSNLTKDLYLLHARLGRNDEVKLTLPTES